MKYFILTGWSKKRNKVMCWCEDFDDYYSGWKLGITNATILDEKTFDLFIKDINGEYRKTFIQETEEDQIVDLKKIEVKLGGWKNV